MGTYDFKKSCFHNILFLLLWFYLKNQRERPVIVSKVDNIPVRVQQFEINSLERSLGHVQEIIASIRGVEKHLRVVGLHRDLLDDHIVAEIRNYVIACEARADYVQVSSGVQI